MFLIPAFFGTALFLPSAYGQTILKGRVSDAETFEPVVFANVVFRGSAIGVKTDFDGRFVLSSDADFDSVSVSFIGYETKVIAVEPGDTHSLEIHLWPALYALQEVKIKPGENPAHELLRKVWEKREENGMENLSSYYYRNYSRTTVYLRKFGDKPAEERTFRLFESEFNRYSVGTGEDNIPALPSYITESVSDNYFLRSPARKYTHIRASRSDGLAFRNTGMISQLVSKQEEFYFPSNNVTIADKSFVSPLSRFGLLFYRYELADTIVLGNKYRCFEVRVTPKRETDPVFRGSFWIHDSTYALRSISVEVAREAELNFIKRVRIQQDYEPVQTGAWFPVKTRFMADAVNIFVTNYSGKSDIQVNKPYDPGFFGSELKISYSLNDHDDDSPGIYRSGSMDKSDSVAVRKLDSLKMNRKMRVSGNLVEASVRGYYNFGWFEAGPWIMLYNHNRVEGSRLRVGGRTNASFSPDIILEGYVAYGFEDDKFKGSIQSEIFLSKERWTKFGVAYRDDVENTGAVDEFFSGSSFLTFATTFGGSDRMNRSQVIRSWFETDLLRGMTGKLVCTRWRFSPAANELPDIVWFSDVMKTSTSGTFVTGELGLLVSYQPKAVYVVDGVRRFPVNFNKYPVFSFQYFAGFDSFLNGDYNYRKVIAGIRHNFNTGGLGSFEYDVNFSKVFGSLPYPLLLTLPGNESVFRTSRTYNLMNYGEFIVDEALELYGSWHMNGLILNRIPLIKRLQWRTVLSGRVAFGSFDESTNGFYDPVSNPSGILSFRTGAENPSVFEALSYSSPYAEISYGIENIFRLLRVDLVRRLTHNSNPGAGRYGVKVSGVFRF